MSERSSLDIVAIIIFFIIGSPLALFSFLDLMNSDIDLNFIMLFIMFFASIFMIISAITLILKKNKAYTFGIISVTLLLAINLFKFIISLFEYCSSNNTNLIEIIENYYSHFYILLVLTIILIYFIKRKLKYNGETDLK